MLMYLLELGILFLFSLFWLRSKKDFSFYFNQVSNAVFYGFLGWKLSLVITDFELVTKNITALLYSIGGPVNWMFGLLIFAIFLFKGVIKGNKSLKFAAVFFFSTTVFLFFSPLHIKDFIQKDASFAGISFEDINGNEFTLGEGRGVILNFWASWCPPCKAEIPELNEFSMEYGDYLIGVNAFSTESSYEKVLQFIESEISYRSVIDKSNTLGQLFEVASLPTTVVIGPQGQLIEKFSGAVSLGWLKLQLKKIK